MHREWPKGPPRSDQHVQNQPAPGELNPPVSTRLSASSWSLQRVMISAVVVALGTLAVGGGFAALLSPSSVAANGTEVTGRTESAAPVETNIGEAAAATRRGDVTPADTSGLTVVQVSVSTCGFRSAGSGVVVADGLLLTAAHVVGDAELVRIDQGGITVTGEVLGVLGDERDVALVAVDAPMSNPVPAGASPELGAALTLVGQPDGQPLTVATGEVVAVAESVASLAGGGDIVGVDVTIAEGMSGGPAVDANGAIVGLTVAKELATDTALIVALPDLATIDRAALVPGECTGSA